MSSQKGKLFPPRPDTDTTVKTMSKDTWYKLGTVEPPNVQAPKIATMTFETEYKGDIAGATVSEFVFADYAVDKTGDDQHDDTVFTGMSTFKGTVLGKSGTFAATINGHCKKGITAATTTIVPDTATGELRGISGSSFFTQPMAEGAECKEVEVTWDITFE